MTNRTGKLLRKGWNSFLAWAMAMDYSTVDYANDRIRGLEHEVKQLKDDLTRTRMSAGAADGGFEPKPPLRET
jgi:hypothetical protein